MAYLLGSIPSGLIVGKAAKGIDIREHGGGNLGATNAFRTLGVKAGSIVISADILKDSRFCFTVFHATGHSSLISGGSLLLSVTFPIFAKFKGKAVALHLAACYYFMPHSYLSR
ncbi:glycerol-3-phosphate acyltransferase [Bacillus sp. SL00103]